MKYILSCFALLLISCNHNIPIANIEFTRIQKDIQRKNSYYLYFSSDVELIDNLSKSHIGARFKCFFKNSKITDKDFESYSGYILESVEELELLSKKEKYNYRTMTFFNNDSINNISESLYEEQLKISSGVAKLINQDSDCLQCVVNAIAYFKPVKRYISNPICLSKKELKKVME